MANQTTESYALGIQEGRAFLKAFPEITPEEIERHCGNLKDLAASHSGEMKDLFKGEIAFWQNQLKIRR